MACITKQTMIRLFDGYRNLKPSEAIDFNACCTNSIQDIENNFSKIVKTMKALSDRFADPEDKLTQVTVVDDQLGRLTFTRDMADAIFHVLGSHAPYGTYNCTGSGAVRSWADIARAVFEAANGNGDRVVPVSTADYYASAEGPVAPRPVHSALDLSKLESTGFHMPDWEEELTDCVIGMLNE